METLTREEVRINRLLKKIEKLKKQVAHYKNRCRAYQSILDMHPLIERRFLTHEEQIAERNRVRVLEKRVLEQEKLIALMEKQKS